MYFESHAHYDDERFDEDRDELLESLPINNIDKVINVGADMASSLASMELAEKYDYIYAAVGVHPHEVKDMTESDLDILRVYAKHKKVVAIGEIGLDYYYDLSPRDTQRYWFKKQLDLCYEVDLPVIIHSRDATQETFDIMKESKVRRGVIHAFSGSAEIAKAYIDMGFYIGVGGVITFKNAKKLIEVVENVNLDRVLIETDSPYLSPVPVRGTRNNSQNLSYICEKIAQITQKDVDFVAEITRKNAETMFDIK